MSDTSSGYTPAVIAGLLAVGILGTGIYLYYDAGRRVAQESPQAKKTPVIVATTSPVGFASPVNISAPVSNSTTSPQGTVLAGQQALLLDFNAEDYQAAVSSGKLVVLYYYANWCPICRAEFPKMQAAFNELTSDQVVGFRVSFNDNETDSAEVGLARQYGVAYQHTKVFTRNGQQLLKSPESWEQDRYVSEITAALNR